MVQDEFMAKRITLIDGHPDPDPARVCHALADAYADAAERAGHAVRRIAVAELDIPLLHTREEYETGTPPPAVRHCQETIGWAEHLVIIYPLWLGSMPALLQATLEQVFRPGFATSKVQGGRLWTKLLTGRTARIVVTMGMPALVYRWYFGAHSLKSLERNILRFVGLGPIRETLIGPVEGMGAAKRAAWLGTLRRLGREGR